MLEINEIHCMDCLEGMQQIPAGMIDLIVTDPPFNFRSGAGRSSFFTRRHKQHILNIEKSFGHSYDPMPFLEKIPRLMNKVNVYIWTSKDLLHKYLNWAVDNGFAYNVLTWHKKNPLPLWNGNYRPDTEYCIFIKEKGAYFNSKIRDKRKYKRYFITKIGNGSETSNIDHPTPKPLALMKNPVEISSKRGDTVLDPYMGSGTTAWACKQLKRNFIGFEIDAGYVKIAEARLKQRML